MSPPATGRQHSRLALPDRPSHESATLSRASETAAEPAEPTLIPSQPMTPAPASETTADRLPRQQARRCFAHTPSEAMSGCRERDWAERALLLGNQLFGAFGDLRRARAFSPCHRPGITLPR
jgi:hypothetical protein